MNHKLKPKNSPPPSAADLTAADAQLVKSNSSAAVAKATTGVQKRSAKAAVADSAVVVEPISVPQVVAQAGSKAAMPLETIDVPKAENVAVGVMAAVPPMPPGLATLTDEINSATCDFGGLGKATIQAALILGQLLLDLVQYVPQAQWSEWVRAHTPLTIANAEASVTFAADHEHLAARVTPIVAMTTTQILEALVGLGDAYKEAAAGGSK